MRSHAKVLFAVAALSSFFALAPAASADHVFDRFVGEPLSGFGQAQRENQFNIAEGIAVDPSTGQLYVTDTQSSRVQRFDRDGHFELTWGRSVRTGNGLAEVCTAAQAPCQAGELGGAEGMFEWPQAIAISPLNGDLYVYERSGFRIQQFELDDGGTPADPSDDAPVFVRAWGWGVDDGSEAFQVCTAGCQTGLAGSGVGQMGENFLGNGAALAISPVDGDVFLAEEENGRIQRFNADGTLDADPVIGPPALSEGTPSAITIDSRGILYAGDTQNGGEIERYDSAGFHGAPGFLAPIPGSLLGEGSRTDTTNGLAVDPDSDGAGADADVLYVMRDPEVGNTSILQLDAPGELAPPAAVAESHAAAFLGEETAVAAGRGLAYDAAADKLYTAVLDIFIGSAAGHGVVAFDADGTGESVTAEITPPSSATSTSAELSGFVDPSEGLARAHFEYSSSGTEPWSRLPTQIVTGSGKQPVTSDLTGLEPNTLYRVRLRAEKVLGPNDIAVDVSPEGSFLTDASPPEATTGALHSFTDSSAWLAGEVDPQGASTTYRFEWGPTTAYEHQAPLSDASAGAGTQPQAFLQKIEGLQPGTTYHYRIVAESEQGTDFGVDRTFTTRPSFGGFAPRAYEQATPAAKLGTEIDADGLVAVAPNGSSVALSALHTFADSAYVGSPAGASIPYQARRNAAGDGWTTKVVSPPPAGFDAGRLGASGVEIAFFGGPSDSLIAFRVGPADQDIGNGTFVKDAVTGSMTNLYNMVQGESGPNDAVGASADMRRVFFETTEVLTGDDGVPVDTRKIYEWVPDLAASVNERQKISVRATAGTFTLSFEGETTAPIAFDASAAAVREALEALPSLAPGDVDVFLRVPSAPATSGMAWGVEFTGARALADVPEMAIDGANLSGGFGLQVFDAADVRTEQPVRLVSVDSAGAPLADSAVVGRSDPSIRRGAVSDDGEHVFFTTPAGGSLSDAAEIYRRSNGATTALVSPSRATAPDPEGPKGKAFAWATPDGDRVFFLSSEQLTDDANTGPGRLGTDLYRYEVSTDTLVDLSATPGGNGARVRAFLGASDDGEWVYYVARGQVVPGAGSEGANNVYLWHDDGSADGETRFVATLGSGALDERNFAAWSGDSFANDFRTAARVSRDGRALLMQSEESLSGYRNQGHSQLYLYEADAHGGQGSLSCVSCRPNGSPASDGVTVPDSTSVNESGDALGRVMSDDGSRVFFQSEEDLLPADGNGKRDVYVWEDGRLGLISTGRSSSDSTLRGVSQSGDDAFIVTREPLVGQDNDDLLDVYDYRVGGGIPQQHPPRPGVPCAGDACKGSVAPQPPVVPPATVSPQGQGNVRSGQPKRRCARGKVRRKGRCVRARSNRKRAAKGNRRTGK